MTAATAKRSTPEKSAAQSRKARDAAALRAATAIKPAPPKAAALILNSAQAEAVYSAMCALNNVCGRIACDIGCVRVTQREDDVVMITVTPSRGEERYAGQHEFATAYGLSTGA